MNSCCAVFVATVLCRSEHVIEIPNTLPLIILKDIVTLKVHALLCFSKPRDTPYTVPRIHYFDFPPRGIILKSSCALRLTRYGALFSEDVCERTAEPAGMGHRDWRGGDNEPDQIIRHGVSTQHRAGGTLMNTRPTPSRRWRVAGFPQERPHP